MLMIRITDSDTCSRSLSKGESKIKNLSMILSNLTKFNEIFMHGRTHYYLTHYLKKTFKNNNDLIFFVSKYIVEKLRTYTIQ